MYVGKKVYQRASIIGNPAHVQQEGKQLVWDKKYLLVFVVSLLRRVF